LKKIFNLVNNSPFSYAAKKDKRQIITLAIVIFTALFSTRVIQKTFAGKMPDISETLNSEVKKN
jgi:ABC-type transport system involved in multi-copper enzyme maturation permease subunit